MKSRENIIDIERFKSFFKNMAILEYRRLEHYVGTFFSTLGRRIFPLIFSGLGIIVVSLMYKLEIKTINDSQTIASALLAFAAMLGGFVIFVSTLAMTPIQNSMANLTPMIRQFLNRDLPSQVSFFLIALLSLFMMSLSVLPEEVLKYEDRFLIGLFVTFVAFDLVRLYQRSTLRLMEPTRAIDLLVIQTRKYLKRCQRGINEFIQLQFENPESQQTRLLISKAYRDHGVEKFLEKCFSDISEVARRAVKSGDLSTCERSLNGLLEVFFKYIEVRKTTISLLPEAGSFGITRTTDTRPMVVSLLENLRKIGNEAVSNNDENVCQSLIKTHESLGCLFVSIGIKDYDDYEESSPDTSMIIGYMDKFVLSGFKAGMEDVALTATYAIKNMAIKAKPNVKYEYFYGTAIEKLSTLCIVSYATNKGPIADEISKNLMFLAQRVVAENHFQKDYILQEIFRRYEMILPLSMKNPTAFFSTMDTYSTTGSHSFLKLTELTLNLYADTVEGKQKNSEFEFKIHDLECVLRKIYDHFREIGSKVTFTDDMTLWNVIAYIKYAWQLLYKLRAWTQIGEQDKKILDDLISRFSSLVGWFFSTDKKFSLKNATEAADAVTYFGILAIRDKINGLPMSCFKSLTYLVEKAFVQYKDQYHRGDVLVKVWMLRVYAEKESNTEIVSAIDNFLKEPVKGMEAEEVANVLNGLENRKGHFEDRLNDYNRRYRLSDSAEDLLCELLEETRTPDTSDEVQK